MHEKRATHANFHKNTVCISKKWLQWLHPAQPAQNQGSQRNHFKNRLVVTERSGYNGIRPKKLSQDIATLRKNRENVPLELLKTKYKKPYAKLKEEIRAQFEIYMKHLIMLGILKTGPDLTGAKAESMVDQIQKIIDEEKAAGHQKEVTHAVFEEFNLAKAENLACGYYTDRVKYEAYAPYWLEHIHQEPDGKVTSDLLPGMTWHPEADVWVSFSEPSFTLMMPPTQAEIDAQHKEDTERFKKYLKEVRQE